MTPTESAIGRLAQANPVTEDAALDLCQRAEADGLPGRLMRTPPRVVREPGGRRRLTMAACGIAIVCLGGLVLASQDRTAPLSVLERTAAAAERSTTTIQGSVRYQRERSLHAQTTVGAHPHTFVVPREIERWTASDGRIVERVRTGRARPVTAADLAAWRRSGQPPLPRQGIRRHVVSAGQPMLTTRERALLLETSGRPVDLLTAIGLMPMWSAGDDPSRLITAIGDLLRDGATPPRLRGGLYMASGTITGATIEDGVADPLGRMGARVGADGRWLHFDPRSGALLAESATSPETGPTWRAILHDGYVARVGQRPSMAWPPGRWLHFDPRSGALLAESATSPETGPSWRAILHDGYVARVGQRPSMAWPPGRWLHFDPHSGALLAESATSP